MEVSQISVRNMEISENEKINLRKQMKRLLKSMDAEKKRAMDHKVCEHVFHLLEISDVDFVYAYRNLSWEVGTEEILECLWSAGIPVALPKVMGDQMEFFHVRSHDDLEEGTFHIWEPKASCKQVDWKEVLVFVPGLAFSRKGARLGKGGGYYDKFLEKEPKHRTAALAYEFQLCEEIPMDDHDRPVDFVITEAGIYTCD